MNEPDYGLISEDQTPEAIAEQVEAADKATEPDHEHCVAIGKCWQDREPCPVLERT